ncbi:hypothetical protein GPECTOR_13g855 [Gonium pectorale]|uniref:PLA2c domain-containing protein n=1 Tax=Gonium pectorale TaxID=33097 RepID=A0A150GNC8_GONPE|nr:hypothetical protein GPECTOR_13g855 [Gonium pectorale]|eukprot:KXZ51366.1 hypothetical protein GPECTOR_13g855 [Gonium pectorale]
MGNWLSSWLGGGRKPEGSAPSNSQKPGTTGAQPQYSIKVDAGAQRPDVPVKTWVAGPDGRLGFPELDDPEFRIPALDDKAPLAICISGGGFRATTLGLGWLRGLHHLGVLERAKYLMVCSGASWLGAAVCFQKKSSLEEFLGPYLPPEECNLKALAKVGARGRTYASAVADAVPLHDYVKHQIKGLVKPKDDEARSWTAAMTASFLRPFGLGDTDTSTVTATGTQGDVHLSVAARAQVAGRRTVYTTDPAELPFPIVVQAVMLPKDRLTYYPFEWTPLYGGCPVAYDKTEPKLGAGWVETLGLNAALAAKPERVVGGTTHVRVRPMGPASLGEAIGISSAYSSYVWKLGKTDKGLQAHKRLGFHTAEYFNQQDWSNAQLELVDGGGTDYNSILPALRRKVPNIMILTATATDVKTFDQFLPEPNLDHQFIAQLFGCWPGNPNDKEALPAAELNARMQIFPKSGFKELFDALRAKLAAGEPPVHVTEYEVKENAALGIPGGWRVRVMWVINDAQPAWEAALPQDTRAKLERDRTSKLKIEKLNPFDAVSFNEFPMYSAMALNYPPELVGLMSNHAAHMLVRCREAVESMLGGGSKEGRAEGGVVKEVAPAGVMVHA